MANDSLFANPVQISYVEYVRFILIKHSNMIYKTNI